MTLRSRLTLLSTFMTASKVSLLVSKGTGAVMAQIMERAAVAQAQVAEGEVISTSADTNVTGAEVETLERALDNSPADSITSSRLQGRVDASRLDGGCFEDFYACWSRPEMIVDSKYVKGKHDRKWWHNFWVRVYRQKHPKPSGRRKA